MPRSNGEIDRVPLPASPARSLHRLSMVWPRSTYHRPGRPDTGCPWTRADAHDPRRGLSESLTGGGIGDLAALHLQEGRDDLERVLHPVIDLAGEKSFCAPAAAPSRRAGREFIDLAALPQHDALHGLRKGEREVHLPLRPRRRVTGALLQPSARRSAGAAQPPSPNRRGPVCAVAAPGHRARHFRAEPEEQRLAALIDEGREQAAGDLPGRARRLREGQRQAAAR